MMDIQGLDRPAAAPARLALFRWALSTNASESSWTVKYVQHNSRNSEWHGIFYCRVF